MASIIKKDIDPSSIEVKLEDQERINHFSKIIHDNGILEERIKTLEKELSGLTNAQNELMLLDDDEEIDVQASSGTLIKYSVGVFAKYFDQEEQKLKSEIRNFNRQMNKNNETASTLRATLYAKFGNTIRLEYD
ncbi:hypothetical protein SNEBB_009837 [Seison nebaliae]|nr:hypothetical protein SNEBB_009837 [Seison nebaliae]